MPITKSFRIDMKAAYYEQDETKQLASPKKAG